MNESNQELIVDLLGGRLSPEEESAALVRIERDPELRSEYETQIAAISLLETSATPTMTPAERSALHASLRRQLHLDETPVPIVAAPSRWQRWWAPIGGLAIAAAVVVGAIVVLPGSLSSSDSNESFQVASAETTATAASESPTDDLAGESDSQSTESGSDGDSAPGATESTLADESPVGDESLSGPSAATLDIAEALAVLPYVTDVDLAALERGLSADPEYLNNISSPSKSSASEITRTDACLDLLLLENPTFSFSPVATTTDDGTPAVVLSVTPADGEPFLAVYSIDACREIINTRG